MPGKCPQGAITVEERDAQAFDEEAGGNSLRKTAAAATRGRAEEKDAGVVAYSVGSVPQAHASHAGPAHGHSCPGSAVRSLR